MLLQKPGLCRYFTGEPALRTTQDQHRSPRRARTLKGEAFLGEIGLAPPVTGRRSLFYLLGKPSSSRSEPPLLGQKRERVGTPTTERDARLSRHGDRNSDGHAFRAAAVTSTAAAVGLVRGASERRRARGTIAVAREYPSFRKAVRVAVVRSARSIDDRAAQCGRVPRNTFVRVRPSAAMIASSACAHSSPRTVPSRQPATVSRA